jgi:hypothetical protein
MAPTNMQFSGFCLTCQVLAAVQFAALLTGLL